MSILQYHFRSRVLNMSTSITVTIPDQSDGKTPWDKTLDDIYYPGKKYPTIYLCHGGSGDNTTWARNTQVELYGNQKRVMTVGMDLEESFCCDMKVGRNYFTYATEEVPRLVQALFPSSPAREDNFVAGFSMGGHIFVSKRIVHVFQTVQIRKTNTTRYRVLLNSFPHADIRGVIFYPRQLIREAQTQQIFLISAFLDFCCQYTCDI